MHTLKTQAVFIVVNSCTEFLYKYALHNVVKHSCILKLSIFHTEAPTSLLSRFLRHIIHNHYLNHTTV